MSSTGASPRERRLALLRLALLAALVGALFAAVALTGQLSAGRVHDAVHGTGVLAPFAFVVVSSLLTVAMFPGPLLAAASGLLFGTALGTPVSIVAATTGAALAFLVARRFGAGAIDRLSGRRVLVVQDFIAQRGFLSVLYARILPGIPYSLVNYAAGLTRVRLLTFAAATALGCAPRAFAYTALGGNLSSLDSPAAIVAYAVLVAMGVGGVVVAARDVRARRALTRSGSGTTTSSPAARSEARP
ncbi:MAG TPA: TVP38/TMEM64 family protein [Conexibacter sp.]|nr:TVP38/TMEM64 family protein [Conexibacter sp.]